MEMSIVIALVRREVTLIFGARPAVLEKVGPTQGHAFLLSDVCFPFQSVVGSKSSRRCFDTKPAE
jgi:hypothetical protein